jgi:hypothetical protein
MVVVVNKDHPARTMAELIAWLKANPDRANYPTPSPVFTLPIEHFKLKTGAPATPIPYRSSNESVTSLMSGQTAFAFIETPAVVPQIAAGNLRPLAVTIPSRIPELPDVPTLAEGGVPDVVAGTWFGLLAPAGTPMPIVKKLESAARQIAASDDFKARMKALSSASIGSTGAELSARMAAEVERWSGQIREHQVRAIGSFPGARPRQRIEHAFGRERLVQDLGAQRFQGVVDGDPDRAHGADQTGFADPFGAEPRRRFRRLDVQDLDVRHLVGHRHQVVCHGSVQEIAILAVDAFLVENRADPLHDPPAHLLVHQERIDDAPAIVDRPLAENLDESGLAIDFHVARLHAIRHVVKLVVRNMAATDG